MTNPIDELIEKLLAPHPPGSKDTVEYWEAFVPYHRARKEAAAALSTLQEQNRKLEALLEEAEKAISRAVSAETNASQLRVFKAMSPLREARALLSGDGE